MSTILLLVISNIFMTTAWYWHLKGGMDKPLVVVILISWAIALVEYCFAVPANRIGFAHGWSPGQLDAEIQANGWLHAPATPELLFDPDLDKKWDRVLAHIGINPAMLSSEAGHA